MEACRSKLAGKMTTIQRDQHLLATSAGQRRAPKMGPSKKNIGHLIVGSPEGELGVGFGGRSNSRMYDHCHYEIQLADCDFRT